MDDHDHGSGRARLAEKGETIKQHAGDAREAAAAATRETAQKANERIEAAHDQMTQRSADAANRVADALDEAAGDLDPDYPARSALRRASAGARSAAELLEKTDMADMVDAVDRFARRNPAAFMGAALLAGFSLSRFATAHPGNDDPDAVGPDTRSADRDAQPRPATSNGMTPDRAMATAATHDTGRISATPNPPGGTI